MSLAVTLLQDKRGSAHASYGGSVLFSVAGEDKTLKSNLVSAEFDLIDSYFPLLRAVYYKTVNLKTPTILAQLVSGHGHCTTLLSIDLICHLGARALHHTCVVLFLKICELYDDRIAVIDMNETREGDGDGSKAAMAVSKRSLDDAVERLRNALLRRRSHAVALSSPEDLSILTGTDNSQSLEAEEEASPPDLTWAGILQEFGLQDECGACKAVSMKLASMATARGNEGEPFLVDARLVLEARQALETCLTISGEEPARAPAVSFTHPSLNRRVQVPVQELWPLLILAESMGCNHVAEEVINRMQHVVRGGLSQGSGAPRSLEKDSGEALYALWSTHEKNAEIRASSEAFLASYRPNEEERPRALRAVTSMKARHLSAAVRAPTWQGEDLTDDDDDTDVDAMDGGSDTSSDDELPLAYASGALSGANSSDTGAALRNLDIIWVTEGEKERETKTDGPGRSRYAMEIEDQSKCGGEEALLCVDSRAPPLPCEVSLDAAKASPEASGVITRCQEEDECPQSAKADFEVPAILPSPAAVQLGQELFVKLRESGDLVGRVATPKPSPPATTSGVRTARRTPTKSAANKDKDKDSFDKNEAGRTPVRRTPVKPPLPSRSTSASKPKEATAPQVRRKPSTGERASATKPPLSSSKRSGSGSVRCSVEESSRSKEVAMLARKRAMRRIKTHKKKKEGEEGKARAENEEALRQKHLARQESILESISKQQQTQNIQNIPAGNVGSDGVPPVPSRSLSPVVGVSPHTPGHLTTHTPLSEKQGWETGYGDGDFTYSSEESPAPLPRPTHVPSLAQTDAPGHPRPFPAMQGPATDEDSSSRGSHTTPSRGKEASNIDSASGPLARALGIADQCDHSPSSSDGPGGCTVNSYPASVELCASLFYSPARESFHRATAGDHGSPYEEMAYSHASCSPTIVPSPDSSRSVSVVRPISRGGPGVATSPSIPISATEKAQNRVKDKVFLHVLRGWDLSEGLGGCNPYVLLEWGTLGSHKTPAIPGTTSPYFSSRIAFRSPVVDEVSAGLLSALEEGSQIVRDGYVVTVYVPTLRISVYSQNVSVSDELIGETEITSADALEMISTGGSHTAQLLDAHQQHAGSIELQCSFD